MKDSIIQYLPLNKDIGNNDTIDYIMQHLQSCSPPLCSIIQGEKMMQDSSQSHIQYLPVNKDIGNNDTIDYIMQHLQNCSPPLCLVLQGEKMK